MMAIDRLERELREHYLSVAPAKVEALAAAIADARTRPADAAAVERLRFVVHKIAGSAGSYGFTGLGDAAKAIELAILPPLPAHVVLAAERFLGRMQEEFAAARAEAPAT